MPKAAGLKRLALTLSMGLNHHDTIRLSSPPTAALARPTSPSLTRSQRRRLTLCVQARRKVPVSSSRATSGAPQNIPITTGTMRTRASASVCSLPSSVDTGLTQPPAPPPRLTALRHGDVVDVHEVGAGDEQDHPENDETGGADQPLHPELSPREGDHERTSSPCRARARRALPAL